MFVFPLRDISELLTWLLVSPECHSAWANTDPGPVSESTSCTTNIKRVKPLINAMYEEKTGLFPALQSKMGVSF